MAGRWGCGSCGHVGFWTKIGLRVHQLGCYGPRRWTCAKCGASGPTNRRIDHRVLLRVHEVRVHGADPFAKEGGGR